MFYFAASSCHIWAAYFAAHLWPMKPHHRMDIGSLKFNTFVLLMHTSLLQKAHGVQLFGQPGILAFSPPSSF